MQLHDTSFCVRDVSLNIFNPNELIYMYGMWQTPLSRAYYIYLIYTPEQLRFKDLAQGANSGSLAGLGFKVTFRSVVQQLNH